MITTSVFWGDFLTLHNEYKEQCIKYVPFLYEVENKNICVCINTWYALIWIKSTRWINMKLMKMVISRGLREKVNKDGVEVRRHSVFIILKFLLYFSNCIHLYIIYNKNIVNIYMNRIETTKKSKIYFRLPGSAVPLVVAERYIF